MDPNIKQSIIDRLKQTNNVLVTVKSSPTVDQLAACIGLTLFLNKQGKHATAVFSGEVPSTIEFLKPESTLEKDTNSLRDFIIALDKSKADKLRYKVEDKVVKIFITPYRTSLSEADLDFSQGDFNVDVVIALGVHAREELDQAIVAHGRILHDATVVSINNSKAADLGALNWNDDKASSLSEMVAGLVDTMQPNTLDAQMATAFLTGIVAETDRFSNPKTTSQTMSLSAKLMAAGANQQLVATKLQEPVQTPTANTPTDNKKPEGTGELDIQHPVAPKPDGAKTPPPPAMDLPLPIEEDGDDTHIHIDENGNLKTGLQDQEEKPKEPTKPSRLALDPPTMGGTLTANSKANLSEPNVDPLSGVSPNSSIISRDNNGASALGGVKGSDVKPTQTLSSIEEEVKSPHAGSSASLPQKVEDLLGQTSSNDDVLQPQAPVTSTAPTPLPDLSNIPASGIDDARKAVESAAHASMNSPLDPVQSLNAQPLGGQISHAPQPGMAPQPSNTPLPPANAPSSSGIHDNGLNLPPNLVPPNSPLPPEQTGINQPPTAPPPVPPPMMPPLPPQNDQNNNGGFNAPL